MSVEKKVFFIFLYNFVNKNLFFQNILRILRFIKKNIFFLPEKSEENKVKMLKKKLLRIVVFCVKVQKRVNADFHKTQYFFFSKICVNLKIYYLRNIFFSCRK